MICLDCVEVFGTERPAVGTCVACGAGVCVAHKVITWRVAPPGSLLGEPSGPRRKLTCLACDANRTGTVGDQTIGEAVSGLGRRILGSSRVSGGGA